MQPKSHYESLLELIQVSLGNRDTLGRMLSEAEWQMLLQLAKEQSLAGVLFEGVKKIMPQKEGGKPSAFFEWYVLQQQIIAINHLQNKRATELQLKFSDAGFRSCILKGQGTALYYENPLYRQCGDIDIWFLKE